MISWVTGRAGASTNPRLRQRRWAWRAIHLALRVTSAAVLASSCLSSCFDRPMPDCAVRCGQDGTCPANYGCDKDQYCRINGSDAAAPCSQSDGNANLTTSVPQASER